MANTPAPPGRKRHAVFAVHGISPHPRYAFQDQVADTLQSFLNDKEKAAHSGHSWDAVVFWPRVAANDTDTVKPSALRLYRDDDTPTNPHGATYDVYEGYWSPLSKGRTNFSSALKWLLNSTFLGVSSTAAIPCSWQKLMSDLTYVAILLGAVLAGAVVALGLGLWAWLVFIRTLAGGPPGSVSFWALLANPIETVLKLPFLAYVELAIDAAAAFALAMLSATLWTGAKRRRKTNKLSRCAKKDGTFKGKTIAADRFHWYASAVLSIAVLFLVLVWWGIHRLVGQAGGWHAVAAAGVALSVLIFQSARSAADFTVENVLGDIQIYTTRDQNSAYYTIREQIVETVSDSLIGVLRATETATSSQPYYDSVHIFGHSLGSTVALDVLIRLRQLVQEGTLAEAGWKRVRSLTTFGSALEKTRFFFDVRHPTVNAAQDQWENDVYGQFFTKDPTVLQHSENSQGIYWSNLWYFRDIVANEIVSYRSDVSPDVWPDVSPEPSFDWTKAAAPREICENYLLPNPRWRFAWVHSDYLQDPLFWEKVGSIITDQFTASTFELSPRLEPNMGEEVGFISERLHDLDLSDALPSERPPRELIDRRAVESVYDSGPTEDLRNANVWSAALETHLQHDPTRRIPRGTVLTTYGFLRVHGSVQLGVIHYLRPDATLAARWPQPITIMGWSFPVIVLPWRPIVHSDFSDSDGNCWVKFLDEAGARKPGVLTARHAIQPQKARLQAEVRVNVSRSSPRGRLRYASEKMDAAVISVDERQWGSKIQTPHSNVVGYKPVRLMTGHGTVDADVVEHTGIVEATIFGEAGKEPLSPALLFLNRMLEPGDSGCLVVDLESAESGQRLRPYLIYLGKASLRGGVKGYGLLIEQANRVWDLECYTDNNV